MRLLLINLIVMAVPLAGMWFARLYETQLLNGLERDMIHQTQVLREALLASENLDLPGRGRMLRRISEHTGLRLRLLGPTGVVLSDSGGPAALVRDRTEVHIALSGRYGSHTRFSPGRRRLNFFSALPVVRNGAVLGVVYASRSTAQVTRALVSLRHHLIRIFWISIGMTVVMTLFLAATISRPLARLASRAEQIADGNSVLSLDVRGSSEISDLTRSFERMRIRLQERADENAAMAADISHEFKSPLTSIQGAAELLLDGAADDAQVRTRFLHNIAEDGARMSRLVGRLLELSRLQADTTLPCSFDLAGLVHEELATRSCVILDAPFSPMMVHGRVGPLRAALANLLDNAEQHTQRTLTSGRAHKIAVHLRCSKGGYDLAVSNHGPEISAANLGKMWQRFFTTRSEHGGSGLGLAIVRSAVESHGGRVHAASECGKTTIGFWLPAS
tara:strand:- start:52942 stop:54282 length:1341 start_codon:yes stop_codon:yes gene_type:complete